MDLLASGQHGNSAIRTLEDIQRASPGHNAAGETHGVGQMRGTKTWGILIKIYLLIVLVTASKPLVTRSDALVTSSEPGF